MLVRILPANLTELDTKRGQLLHDFTNVIYTANFFLKQLDFPAQPDNIGMIRRIEGRCTDRSLESLEEMRVRNREGTEMPFSEAARVRLDRGYSTITRVDRRRTINVTANADSSIATAGAIRADLDAVVLPALAGRFATVQYKYAGQAEEQAESFEGVARSFIIALASIFILLAIPFKSYLQPAIVMSVIPFGLIGAVLGHLFLGMHLTMLSIFGVIALTGVVVNDSLVLVDFVNRDVRSGRSIGDAIRRAGEIRFRPILLTSLTTFAGLTPLLLERSLQAQFLKPMAASLAFGVVFATPIILILVPVLYLILEDVKALGRRLLGRRPPVAEPVPHGS